MNKRDFGERFEGVAKDYLLNKGYLFIESNYYTKYGEIDLVMKENDFIVFVEVKTLNPKKGFNIYESLTRNKKRSLKSAINSWLYSHKKIGSAWRLDFVGIEIDFKNNVEKIEHFEFVKL